MSPVVIETIPSLAQIAFARDRCASAKSRALVDCLRAGFGEPPSWDAAITTASKRRATRQPWYCRIVFGLLISSSAISPFSRPWPLPFIPPNGSSTPPPAP